MWLRDDLVAVGRSLRTNQAGIDQLAGMLDEQMMVFDVPVHGGPDACLHLMSSISMVHENLALIEPALMPSGLFRLAGELGISLIGISTEESATLAGNVLAVQPGVIVAVEGNPITRSVLDDAGAEVHTFAGTEIALNGPVVQPV